jgi:quercetin dioxygenase-like cupin family protein
MSAVALEPQVVTTSEPLWFLGTLVRPKLSGRQTGGRFALWEGLLPHGAAPPLHTHPQDESFYVLEGNVVVWVGARADEGRACREGAAVFVPGGVPHTFRVESDTARMLFLSTPAGIEEFVQALAEPAAWPWLQPPPDEPRVPADRLATVEREHAVIRLGPPPTQANTAEDDARPPTRGASATCNGGRLLSSPART